MRIYIASSWRQSPRVRALATRLTAEGHEVFDFTQQKNAKPRDELPVFTTQPYADYMNTIRPLILEQISNDVRQVTMAQLLVLLLPCGSDAHFELGLAYGCGLRTVVVGQPAPDQFVGMHFLADAILEHDSDVLDLCRS